MTRIAAQRVTGAATRRLSIALLALALALFAGGSDTAHAYTWSTVTVNGSGDNTGERPSITVDGNGVAMISYYGYDQDDPIFSSCVMAESTNGNCDEAGDWHGSTITDQTRNAGGSYTSIALDANGDPVVSFASELGLEFAICDISASGDNCYGYSDWDTVVLSGGSTWQNTTSIAVDANGDPMIAANQGGANLQFAICDMSASANGNCDQSGDWESVSVDSTDPSPGDLTPSIAVDANGDPVISYSDNDSQANLRFAICDMSASANGNCDQAGDWDKTVVFGGLRNWDTAIAVDGNGDPMISYRPATFNLKFAVCDMSESANGNCDQLGDWSHTVIDSTTSGSDTSLAVDENGDPVIAYPSNGLKFAICDMSASANGNCDHDGDWNTEAVPDADGRYRPSIALDNGGYPVIAYEQHHAGTPTDHDLKFATATPPTHTFTVDDTGDAADASPGDLACATAGAVCTLRAAIQEANAAAGTDTIEFNIPGAGPHTITPGSALPTITQPVVIDGTTEPDFAGTPVIELDGTSAGGSTDGLTITAGDSTVKGLVINSFSGNGIRLEAAGGNTIQGNYIGTDVAGAGDAGNTLSGVYVFGAPGNTIGGDQTDEGNVISGNDGFAGVAICGNPVDCGGEGPAPDYAAANVVRGNLIGTNASGTAAIANSNRGVSVDGSPDTVIGGTSVGARNVISGNGTHGILIFNDSEGTVVQGNYIGISATGASAMANSNDGVVISAGALNNTIGGTTTPDSCDTACNVISGNGGGGVQIDGSGTDGNTVKGNHIGTNAAGDGVIPNTIDGIRIQNTASGNTIGGDTAGERNVISGNGGEGVEINGSGSNGNTVSGNYIGTNVAGDVSLANGSTGVLITDSAQSNTVGGSTEGERNVISSNGGSGVAIAGAATSGNVVKGNYIGTNAAGTGYLGNSVFGLIISGAPDNTIGGDTAGARNVISGNNADGVHILNAGSTGNQVQGNYIGTNAAGTAAVANAKGISISEAANNTIGGTSAGQANVISGNNGNGLELNNASTTGNVAVGNYIGTDATGTAALGNSRGVEVSNGAHDNTIGGTAPREGNTIAFNSGYGVSVIVNDSTGNSVRGNSIHSNLSLGIDLGGDGVTANDSGDGDSGPNNLMNFPVITSATYDGVKTTVSGTLDTGTPETAVVDVYATDAVDGSGYGEGRAYVGSAAPDALGDWTLVVSGFPPYAHLSATATDASDNTSEFSETYTPPVGASLPLVKIVEEGDATPIGGTFASLGRAWVPDTTDDVAFWASTSGPSEGIFKYASSVITKLVAEGDSAPIGSSFSGLGSPTMNEDGDAAFWAEVDGTTEGIFLYTAPSGPVTKVAAVGDSTPSSDSFTSFSDTNSPAMPVINNDGDIAFWGKTSSGEGVFLYTGSGLTEIALTGESAPGTGGEDFATFVTFGGWPTVPIVTNNGQVSFWGEGDGGTEGIFLSTDGVVDDVVVAGDATPAGGTYSLFGQAPSPNDSGEIAFWAALSGVSAPNCPSHAAPCAVFRVSDGTAEKVIISGDVGPLAVRGTVSDIGTVPLLNDSGQVTFRAEITGGLADEVLVRFTDGVMENVAAEGNTAPASTFTGFDPTGPAWAVPNNPGQVAFWGEVDGATEGIFLAGDATFGTTVEVAALAGANAPGCGATCQFGSNFDLDINNDGKAIFANTLTDGTATSGIFRFFAGSVEDVALQGQTAPDASGATFSTFGPPVNNDSDDVVGRVTLSDGKDALYRFFSGSPDANPEPVLLALEDEPAPGTNRFFAGFAEPAINNLGYVIAAVTTDDGAEGDVKDALYLFFAGSAGSDPVVVAEEGQETAQGTGRFFAGFAQPAINDMGQVVARATLDDGNEGLYRFFAGSPQNPEPLAQEDDPAPETSRFFAGFGQHPDINLLGDVAYQATIDDGREALYLFFAGSSTTVLLALQDDVAPSGAGGTYSGFGDPVINDHDQVVAQATIDSGSASEGLFLFFAGTPTGEVALQADTAESGGQYGGGPPVFPYVAYNNNAEVVYVANIVDGPSPQGVFIATLDIENDGVLDHLDNCPTVFNTDQKNTDKALAPVYSFVVADELGNACDDDIDGDGYPNNVDGCSTNPTRWQTPLGDTDCDGFTDGYENTCGTDPLAACPSTSDANDEEPDAWPPDWDDTQTVNLLDLLPFKTHYGATDPLDPLYDARFDLNMDDAVNLLDLLPFKPFFNVSCTT